MGSIEELNADERIQLANIVQEAADDIVEFGWVRGQDLGYDTDINGKHSRCVWVAAGDSVARNVHFRDEKYLIAVEDAVLKAAEVSTLTDLFDTNDSQTEEEGQAWAYGVLISASHILNPALVDGEKARVTPLTEKTDTGSTRSVVSRIGSFLKRFIWVR